MSLTFNTQPDNGGIVMVNFYPYYINCSPNASVEQVAGNGLKTVVKSKIDFLLYFFSQIMLTTFAMWLE